MDYLNSGLASARDFASVHQIDLLLGTFLASLVAVVLSLIAIFRRRTSRRLRRTVARMQAALDHLQMMETQRMLGNRPSRAAE